MEIQDESTNCDALELCDLSSDQRLDRTGNPDPDGLIRWPKLSSVPGPRSGASHCFDDSSVAGTDLKKSQDRARGKRVLRITLSEFVESRFIPGYVVERRAAGRAHFRAILKHILTPEAVDAAFAISSGASSRTLKTASHWPYLGSVRLGDVTSEMIQHLTATALQQGYSIQTATHIRNVIRTVFSYAVQTGCHVGTNPAAAVRLPALAHSNRHALTLPQLNQLMSVMRYPEKEIVLFSVLTEMSVVEICGLQWRYFNSTAQGKWADGEFIPPSTIAIRNQYYRGEFGPVTGSRRRFVRATTMMSSLAGDLKKARKQFTKPDDFVLAARNGSPINPENIATRRLKSIGQSQQMPWLSWGVFQRTRSALQSRFGKEWSQEVEKTIFNC